jgi:hypothetical protein
MSDCVAVAQFSSHTPGSLPRCEQVRRRFPQSLTENQKVSERVAGRIFRARANASSLMECVRRRLAMREF